MYGKGKRGVGGWGGGGGGKTQVEDECVASDLRFHKSVPAVYV